MLRCPPRCAGAPVTANEGFRRSVEGRETRWRRRCTRASRQPGNNDDEDENKCSYDDDDDDDDDEAASAASAAVASSCIDTLKSIKRCNAIHGDLNLDLWDLHTFMSLRDKSLTAAKVSFV